MGELKTHEISNPVVHVTTCCEMGPLTKRKKDEDDKVTSKKGRKGTGIVLENSLQITHKYLGKKKKSKLYLEEVCDFLLLGEIFPSQAETLKPFKCNLNSQ